MTPTEATSQPDNPHKYGPIPRVPWNPWLGLLFVLALYFLAQLASFLIVSLYPLLRQWTQAQTTDWLNNAVVAQFAFIAVAEALILGGIYLFLRFYKTSWRAIGLRRPRWRDGLYGVVAWVVYIVIYLIIIGLVSHLVPSLNVNQHQDIGFNNVHGVTQLVLTFISLVILPPFTEEVMVRGFLYGSLKKGMPKLAAALVTSVIFASAHLPEGGAAGPLYIAAIDTFILSLVLVYLREKTNNLWAGITLHALKNGIAFAALFIFVSH